MKPLILASTPCPPITGGPSMVRPKRKTRRLTDSPVLTSLYLRERNRTPRTHHQRIPTPAELRIVWERISDYTPRDYDASHLTSGHVTHTLGQYLREALKK